MRILITGPQGSGKTTHAKILSEKLGLCLVDAGDLIREFSQVDSEEGRKIKEAIDGGKLIDDGVAASLVANKINSTECPGGYVVDGYPRDIGSLELFDPKFDKVIYLEISDEEAERRLLLRGREDDTAASIKERLNWYHQQTEPVLDYYRKEGKFFKIDGERSIDEVAKDIENMIVQGERDE